MAFEDWLVAHARTAAKPHPKLTIDDLMSFFHQLSTLIQAGAPLLQAIRIAAEQSESLKLQRVLGEVAGRLAAGSSLHAAVAGYPAIFEHSWVEMIRTGEVTGKMSMVLRGLNAQVQETRAARRKLRGALFYPIVLLCVAVLAVTAMLWLVVPTFARMFREMNAPLPEVTRFVIGASDFVVDRGLYVAAGLAAAIFAFRRYYRTDEGRRRVLGTLMVVPTVGDALVQSTMYQFTSNLALLLESGVPMIETLETLRGILGYNPIYRDALGRVRRRVASGQSLAAALEDTGLFTAMVVNMARTGEESGELGPVMRQIAPYYKERVEALVAKVSKSLEPAIVVAMGIAIATMMLSIYLPMFNMSGSIR